MLKLPPVTIRAFTRAVLLRKWGALVTGLWGLVGVLDYVNDHRDILSPRFKAFWETLYVLPSFGWRTWLMIVLAILTVSALQGAYSFARTYDRRYQELMKHRLAFQVEERRSLAYVHQESGDLTCVQVAVAIQFKNHEQYPMTLDNWKHRLRLTVIAMNQEPLSATLFFDWVKAAEKPTSCFPVWPHSLAAPARYLVIGSSKADEEIDSRGFAIFTKEGKTLEMESPAKPQATPSNSIRAE